MKTILWALIIIILAGALGFGTYWFFQRQENGGPSLDNISIGDFFPFGNGGQNTPTPEPGTNTEPIPAAPAPITRLWKISTGPQSGAGFFTRGTETFVRFIGTAMGNVHESQVSNREALQASSGAWQNLVRISNTTVPKIKEAIWLASGNGVTLRYTNDAGVIQTMHAKIAPMQASVAGSASATSTVATDANLQELQGTFLPSNITSLALFAPKDRIFYMVKSGTGAGMGYTAAANGASPTKIFESSINEWVASWPRESTIVLTTKPSAFALGYSYTMSPVAGGLTKLLGGIAGLSVNPAPNLTKVIYSESVNGSVDLKLFDTKTGARTLLTKTFAEKCVWQKDSVRIICAAPKTFPGGNYPDNWYDGQITLADSLWSIDTGSGQSAMIADLRSLAGEDIDAINLSLDTNEKILLFTNKKDSALWAFDLVI